MAAVSLSRRIRASPSGRSRSNPTTAMNQVEKRPGEVSGAVKKVRTEHVLPEEVLAKEVIKGKIPINNVSGSKVLM